MPKVKLLGLFFLLIYSLEVYSAESIVEQYNTILSNPDSIDRVKMSQSAKDNLAVIRISGHTFTISSSIINGFLIKNIPQASSLLHEVLELYSDDYRPISVMDLLYLNPEDTSLSFFEKLNQSRIFPLRTIIEKLITLTFVKKNTTILNSLINNLVTNGDDSLCHQEFRTTKNETGNIKEARLQLLKKSIIDFLFRLRHYANNVAVIPSVCPEQNKESHHLLTNKETLTKLDTAVLSTKKSNGKIIIEGGDRSKQIGMIEFILSQIDIRLLEHLGARFSKNVSTIISSHDYDQIISTKIEDISEWMILLFKIISSPWCGNLGGAAGNYMRAITHTEQMVDWLSKYFGDNIFVKISGKAPCVKCPHYIQYAITDSTRIRENWDKKTIIGFNTGWRSGSVDDISAYRYPVMVFNYPIGGIGIRTFSPHPAIDNLPDISVSNYQEGEFDITLPLGIGRSHCYAIENVDGVQDNEEGTRYKGQLTIQPDGSIVQTKTDREADSLLIPYTPLPHTEDSSEETVE